MKTKILLLFALLSLVTGRVMASEVTFGGNSNNKSFSTSEHVSFSVSELGNWQNQKNTNPRHCAGFEVVENTASVISWSVDPGYSIQVTSVTVTGCVANNNSNKGWDIYSSKGNTQTKNCKGNGIVTLSLTGLTLGNSGCVSLTHGDTKMYINTITINYTLSEFADEEYDANNYIVNSDANMKNVLLGWDITGTAAVLTDNGNLGNDKKAGFFNLGHDGEANSYEFKQTVSGLLPGYYKFSVDARIDKDTNVKCFAGTSNKSISGNGWTTYTIEGVKVGQDGNLTIGVSGTHYYTREGGFFGIGATITNGWCNVDNFRLEYMGRYERSLTKDAYGTLCLPKAVNEEDLEGIQLYRITKYYGSKENPVAVHLETVSGGVEAGVPYIFQATGTSLKAYYSDDDVAEASSDNGLVGLLEDEVVNPSYGNVYVLSNGEIKKLKENSKMKINMAYIDLRDIEWNKDLEVKGDVLGFEDGVTAISGVTLNGQSKVYDLQGRKVVNPTNGLFIINGKKVMVVK